jgi:hypothetical protein
MEHRVHGKAIADPVAFALTVNAEDVFHGVDMELISFNAISAECQVMKTTVFAALEQGLHSKRTFGAYCSVGCPKYSLSEMAFGGDRL